MYPNSYANANDGNSGSGNVRYGGASFGNNGFANSGGSSYSWGNGYVCQLFLILGVRLLVLFTKILGMEMLVLEITVLLIVVVDHILGETGMSTFFNTRGRTVSVVYKDI